MPTVRFKQRYIVQSCPKCNKKLLKVAAGSHRIGSPLITCKNCQIVYNTPLRVEWYKYGPKWMVFGLPFIMAAIMFIVGIMMNNIPLGIMAAVIGFCIGLCISGCDCIRIYKSKKRMRDGNYLNQLLKYNVIDQNEFGELATKIKD